MAFLGENKDGHNSGVAADFGGLLRSEFTFRSLSAPVNLVLSLGMNIQNVGPGFKYEGFDAESPLPRNRKLGLGIDLRIGEVEFLTMRNDILRIRFAYDRNKSLVDYSYTSDLTLDYKYLSIFNSSGSGLPAIWNRGLDVTIAGIVSGRLGYIHDPDGEITDRTYGVGFGINPGAFSFTINWSSIPQALDFDRTKYITLEGTFYLN